MAIEIARKHLFANEDRASIDRRFRLHEISREVTGADGNPTDEEERHSFRDEADNLRGLVKHSTGFWGPLEIRFHCSICA